MRAMSEAPGGDVDEAINNLMYSPTGSATTGMSGGSSLGLQYKGAWCTPPRVFVDYQVLDLNQNDLRLPTCISMNWTSYKVINYTSWVEPLGKEKGGYEIKIM